MKTISITEKDHGYEPSAVRDCSTYQFRYVADDLLGYLAFGIGVSTIKKWLSAVSIAQYALMPERGNAESLIGLSKILRMTYAHSVRRMKRSMVKKLIRLRIITESKLRKVSLV